MKYRAGFTIVEVIIVIAILGILLTLAVVNLSGQQASARDEERKVDVATIASNLEVFYTSGSDSLPAGSYPGTDQLTNESSVLAALRDLDPAGLKAPGYSGPGISFIPATNAVQTTVGVLPQPTPSQYVYQPIVNNILCTATTTKCRLFNIYYKSEVSGIVAVLKSKNR